jgi:hypothetical protein
MMGAETARERLHKMIDGMEGYSEIDAFSRFLIECARELGTEKARGLREKLPSDECPAELEGEWESADRLLLSSTAQEEARLECWAKLHAATRKYRQAIATHLEAVNATRCLQLGNPRVFGEVGSADEKVSLLLRRMVRVIGRRYEGIERISRYDRVVREIHRDGLICTHVSVDPA